MADPRIVASILKDWDLQGMLDDLIAEQWSKTEPGRIDRMARISSYEQVKATAKKAIPVKEWKEAENNGVEDEIVEKYIETLGDILTKILAEHVYATIDEDSVFIGQYEHGDLDELREQGFDISE